MTLTEIFDNALANNASDIHLIADSHPVIRVDGKLAAITTIPQLTPQDIETIITPILTDPQKEVLVNNRSLDFSHAYGVEGRSEKGRFRINLYYQKDTLAAAFRVLPKQIKTIEELGLPQICHTFAALKQGFILVTGPTGQGKSTTLASIINEINMTRPVNIITIEDPIEYIYPPGKSIISQREIGIDTLSWGEALRSALREDPDVLLIGEMRDPESTASAITIAETGHLVFSTLHTNSASQSINRIIDSFPEHQQNQIKIQLSTTIGGIISQRLVPRIDGGRVVASEIMIATNAIRSNIREGKTHLLDSTIETSQDAGMISLEASLADLVKRGIISVDVAQGYSLRKELLTRLISS